MKGYLTIFLTLTLTVVISLCLTLVEGVRRNTMVLEIECVTDTGMNSVLAEYHRELLRQYGLFFVDVSYGTGIPSYGAAAEHLTEYMNRNFICGESLTGAFGRDLLALRLEQAEVTGVSNAADEQGAVLRRQAAAYMKEKVGTAYLEKVLEWMQVVEENDLDGAWIRRQEEAAWGELEEWEQEMQQQRPEYRVDQDTFIGRMLVILHSGVLNLLIDTRQLSGQVAHRSNYLSGRTPLQGTGMNPDVSWQEGIWERLLFHEYILEKTGRYGAVKEGSLLQYQTEYILAGQESDVDNMRMVTERLLLVREAANMVYIAGSEEKMTMIQETADGIAAALLSPEISPLIQFVILAAWAGAESLRDVDTLLDGGSVPLIKSDSQWSLELDRVTGAGGEEPLREILEQERAQRQGQEQQQSRGQGQPAAGTGGQPDGGETAGLYYQDYLRLLLLFQSKGVTAYRLMDIMEMDIRQTPGNGAFRMDGCIDSMEVRLCIVSGYGQEFYITRRYGY